MFKRLTELVGRPGLWEDTTECLLELIDHLNQTFLAYEDYLKRVHRENEVSLIVFSWIRLPIPCFPGVGQCNDLRGFSKGFRIRQIINCRIDLLISSMVAHSERDTISILFINASTIEIIRCIHFAFIIEFDIG